MQNSLQTHPPTSEERTLLDRMDSEVLTTALLLRDWIWNILDSDAQDRYEKVEWILTLVADARSDLP